jgi:hypothetical protein
METFINDFSSTARRLICIMCLFALSTVAESITWIDSAAAQYGRAAERYDSVTLRKTAEFIERQPSEKRQTPKALLTLGLIYWRLELIAFCVGDKPQGAGKSTIGFARDDQSDQIRASRSVGT